MLHEYFKDLLVIAGLAVVIVTIFNIFRIPTLVGFLGAGVIIGPHGLGLVSSLPGTQIITDIGMIFLLFTIGLEFSFQKLNQYKKSFFFIGAVQVLLTILAVFMFCKAFLAKDNSESLVWGFLLSLSSTAVVLKLLSENRELETLHGSSAMSILLSQDLLVIPMLMILPLLSPLSGTDTLGLESSPFHLKSFVIWVTKIILILSVLLIFAKKYLPIIFDKIVRTNSRELFFFSLIFICFSTAYLFEVLHLSISLGAFVAGLLIAESPYGKQVVSDSIPFRDIFLGLFFISIGMLLDTRFIFDHWIRFIFIGLFVLFTKTAVVYLTLRLNQLTHSVALLSALLVSQVGEFSFVIANEALKLNLISDQELQFFIAVSILSLIVTPLLFKYGPSLSSSNRFASFFPKRLPVIVSKPSLVTEKKEPKIDHTIIVGYGVAGQSLAKNLKNLSIPYMIIEFNPNSFKKYRKKEKNILFGDASSQEILERAYIESAKLIVITASGLPEQIQNIIIAVRKIRPDVKIILRMLYARNAVHMNTDKNIHTVVSEFETAVEVIAQSLDYYGVTKDNISQNVEKTRTELAQLN